MNNNLKLIDTDNIEQIINSIKDDLSTIKMNFDKNIIIPVNLYDLEEHLMSFYHHNKDKNINITDLISIDYLFFFRTVLINSNSLRIIILQIFKDCIKIHPQFTNKILDAMIPILISKFFEDIRLPFEERYTCIRLFNLWLKLSDENFPLIFLQSIAAMAKVDDIFKIGCIEFLRMTSITRPDLVSTVDGFEILINALIEENLPKDLVNKIIYSLIYVINLPNKRKYFNGFGDLYKIFSVFTKSDFSLGNNINTNSEINEKQKEEMRLQREKLEKRLNKTIPIIIKFLYSWPGYCYIMRDKLTISSLLIPLNNDVNIMIKKAILKLFKEILDICNNIYDNFNKICSDNKDYFYINKIYIAYIIKELYSNNLNEHLMKFIEEIDSDELRNNSMKILIKFNILFTKVLNNDLRSTFSTNKIEKLKWFEESKYDHDILENNFKNDVYHNEELLDYVSNAELQKAPIQIKIMHIIDIVFHHLECRDTPFLTPQTISSEIIIAINSMLNLDYIKKYENQYSIESAKEEIYSKDDEYTQIIKNSKILEIKEFQQWDWTQIDSLIDIVEVKKELMSELNKMKIFKKILYLYSPSKNLIVKMPWMVNNFFYGAIGKKLFKILSDTQEGIEILDSPNEDTIFQKAYSWIKDVMQCMEEILEKNDINEEHPFHIKRINNTLSRNIFIFIGIISNSKLGDDYLNKQGFYSLLNRFVLNKNNKYDYLITLLIDNINFNSKYTSNWIQKIIEVGNIEIRRYVLNHIRCLLKFGKEVIIDIKVLFNILNQEFQEIDKIIVSILEIMISKGKMTYNVFKEKLVIDKISQVDNYLLYILMRDEKIFNYLIDVIKNEADKLDVNEIVEKYAKEMNQSLIEVFNLNEEAKNKYYLNINLSEIHNRYNNYYEYFWIKQLPLDIVVQKIENNDKRYEYLLINYLEYNVKENVIKMSSKVQEQQKIIIDKNTGIQIICFLGRITLNRNCNEINNASNFLALSYKDILKNIVPYKNYKNIYIIQKDSINIILKQNEDKFSYILDKIFFNIQIRPNPIIGLKTPINLITELINNEKGYGILEQKKFIEKLTSYIEKTDIEHKDKNSSKIRSALYMLTKILMKKNGKYFNDKYHIIDKMVIFFNTSTDFSLRGTLLYITSFLALNEEIRPEILKLRTSYFCNTSICYPSEPQVFDFENKECYENEKLDEEMNLIETEVKLDKTAEEIYDYATNLINNILTNSSNNYLKRIFTRKKESLIDVNLFVKMYAVFSRYKLKEPARKFLMELFSQSIFSNKIALEAMCIIKSLGDNLLNAHNLE